jgi:hypothetical protein
MLCGIVNDGSAWGLRQQTLSRRVNPLACLAGCVPILCSALPNLHTPHNTTVSRYSGNKAFLLFSMYMPGAIVSMLRDL